jgi:hypothetical protein
VKCRSRPCSAGLVLSVLRRASQPAFLKLLVTQRQASTDHSKNTWEWLIFHSETLANNTAVKLVCQN